MGRIPNKSRFILTGATLQMTAADCRTSKDCEVKRQTTADVGDGYCQSCMLYVPPGDARTIAIRLEKLDQLPREYSWSYRVVELRGK